MFQYDKGKYNFPIYQINLNLFLIKMKKNNYQIYNKKKGTQMSTPIVNTLL